ncbi:nucleoside/nucleotide kinase family protein [Gordonia soli]|uniref:Phosphoribulokinase/uridine kinase domain-containing protein n=1 Tax=Gordonia soli NBRC 108243 TaxID=1223545 RepID=M0QNC3_9ACTN|nr:nucleoside/nucleotide kinase family protein [Gordonia soli]GAC69786.1 hypothetical protein GS4_28_00340 [Gordonia soli NBRC 108243]
MTGPGDLDDLLVGLGTESGAGARVVVGITGAPGAGKTTVALDLVRRCREHHGDSAVGYLPMDGFHLSNAVLRSLGRETRKGAPDTFDAEGFAALLERVVGAYRRSDVYCPDFDHTVGEPISASLVIPSSARLVVVEGNYLGLDEPPWDRIAPLLDRLVYVDAPADVRRDRLTTRHIAAGKTPEQAGAWIADVDEPNAAIIAGTRTRADLFR